MRSLTWVSATLFFLSGGLAHAEFRSYNIQGDLVGPLLFQAERTKNDQYQIQVGAVLSQFPRLRMNFAYFYRNNTSPSGSFSGVSLSNWNPSVSTAAYFAKLEMFVGEPEAGGWFYAVGYGSAFRRFKGLGQSVTDDRGAALFEIGYQWVITKNFGFVVALQDLITALDRDVEFTSGADNGTVSDDSQFSNLRAALSFSF